MLSEILRPKQTEAYDECGRGVSQKEISSRGARSDESGNLLENNALLLCRNACRWADGEAHRGGGGAGLLLVVKDGKVDWECATEIFVAAVARGGFDHHTVQYWS